MIIEFSIGEVEAAKAVPGPKFIWQDTQKIVVYTGDDIPPEALPRARKEVPSEVIKIRSGAGTHEILMRQEILMRNEGGFIELDNGGKYTIDDQYGDLELNIGGGIGLIGKGSWLDARNVSAGKSAITLVSRPLKHGAPFPGCDENVTNYHQQRAYVDGFSLIGKRGGDQEHHGIDINMSTAISSRSPRPTLRNFCIQGFDRAVRHRNFAYMVTLQNFAIFNAKKAFSYEGGLDQGEQTNLILGALFNSDVALYFDTQTETGTPENIDLNLSKCSIDYNKQPIVFASGYGRIRFDAGCHFEWNSTLSEYPFDLAAPASNRLLWLFDSPNIIFSGATKNFPAPFIVGDNHDVRVDHHHTHNVTGKGVQITADKSPTGGPTVMHVLANVTGTGRFKADGIVDLTATNLPRVATNSPNNNWLAGGGFEEPALADLWYVYDSSGVGALSRTTSEFHTGTASLQCPMTTGANTKKQVALLVPKRGRFVGVSAFLKLSAGSGSVQLKAAPVVCRVPGAPGAVQSLEKAGPISSLHIVTLSPAGWVNIGQAGNLPRYELPDWATHLLLIFDMYSVNNNGGHVYIDDVHVETW